jgi:hypothetical protein
MKTLQYIKKNQNVRSKVNSASPNEFRFSNHDNIPRPQMQFLSNINSYFLSGIVFAVATLLYLNSLHGEFVLDDAVAIVGNKDIHPSTPILDIFVHDYWGANITNPLSHKSYRPLTTLTFRLNYLLHGYSVVGYHATNILLHSVTSALLHRLLLNIVTPFRSEKFTLAAFVATLYFSAHPIHTEAVANLAGRAEMLGGMFYILAMMSYWNAVTTETKHWHWKRFLFYLGIFLCVIFSGLSKEIGFTLPPVLGAMDVFLIPKRATKILRIVTLVILTIVLISARWYLVGATQEMLHQRFWADNRVLTAEPFVRTLTFFYLPSYNAFLLLWPMSLSSDYNYNCIPFVKTLSDIRNLASLALYVSLMVPGVYGLIVVWRGRDSHGHWRLTLFGLSWLILSFIPASHLLVPVGFIIAERVLYTPSMGLTVIVTVVFASLFRRYPRATLAIAIAILAVFSAQVIRRNEDWRSDMHLVTSALKVCPQSVRVRYTYAKILIREHRYEEALTHLKVAVDIDPEDPANYHWLAEAHLGLNHTKEALAAATQAFLLSPYEPDHINLLQKIFRIIPELRFFSDENDPFMEDEFTHQYSEDRIRQLLLAVADYLNVPRLVHIAQRMTPVLVKRN